MYTVYFSADLRGSVIIEASCADEARDKFNEMCDDEILYNCYSDPAECAVINDVERVG